MIRLPPEVLRQRCGGIFVKRDSHVSATDRVDVLWELPEARRVVGRQSQNGSWRYAGGKHSIRSQENYDQLETFRQLGILVEKFGFTRQHPSIERAATYLLSFQTDEGDLRGIYGNQYATTYVGAILELLIKAGYADDPRIANALSWLLAMRQNDGGWAIPVRTVGVPSQSSSMSHVTGNRLHPTGRSRPPPGHRHGATGVRRPSRMAQRDRSPGSGRTTRNPSL